MNPRLSTGTADALAPTMPWAFSCRLQARLPKHHATRVAADLVYSRAAWSQMSAAAGRAQTVSTLAIPIAAIFATTTRRPTRLQSPPEQKQCRPRRLLNLSWRLLSLSWRLLSLSRCLLSLSTRSFFFPQLFPKGCRTSRNARGPAGCARWPTCMTGQPRTKSSISTPRVTAAPKAASAQVDWALHSRA